MHLSLIFLNIWYYNINKVFFLFPFSNPPFPHPHSPSNLKPQYSLLLHAHVCVCVYACIYISPDWSIIMLPLYMFSELTVRHCTNSWWDLPWGAMLPGSSVNHSSLCRIETSKTFPIHFGISIGVILVQVTIGQSCFWDFMGLTDLNVFLT